MNCSELDQMLCPYLDGEFGPDERLELEGHLATCPACARKVHQESAFRSAFRARAREAAAVPLPEGFRERVREQIQAEDRRARFRAVMPYAAAAALLAAAGGGYALRTPARTASPPEVPPPSSDDKPDRHHFPVPFLANASPESAQVSNDKGREVARITYKVRLPGHEARRVHVFIFPDKRDFAGVRPLSRPKMFPTKSGRNAVIWCDDEVIYQLEGEGDLDDADILRMVSKALPAWDEVEPATPRPRPRPRVPYQPAGLRR